MALKPVYDVTLLGRPASPGAPAPELYKVPLLSGPEMGSFVERCALWPGVNDTSVQLSDVYGVDDTGNVVALPLPGAPTQSPAQQQVSPPASPPAAPATAEGSASATTVPTPIAPTP